MMNETTLLIFFCVSNENKITPWDERKEMRVREGER